MGWREKEYNIKLWKNHQRIEDREIKLSIEIKTKLWEREIKDSRESREFEWDDK